MLFDVTPKEKLSDFFDYRVELDELIQWIKDKQTKMIVIRGLRRTGKSSLVRVALSEAKVKNIFIDARELTAFSRKSFEARLLHELKGIKGLTSSLLERIESVEVGVRVSVKNEENIWDILRGLHPVIALDEAQTLRGTGVEAFLAAAYDNTKCKIILTGSEVGVLDSFIGNQDPKAPLFGRAYNEIKTRPLTSEKAIEFLQAGFRENRKTLPKEEAAKITQELDGIIGWLAMFGNYSLSRNTSNALKYTITIAKQLAYAEVENFLGARPSAKKRYLTLLNILAKKETQWSKLKQSIEAELDEKISDTQFSNYLNSLIEYGFITFNNNTYDIPDPMLKKAFNEGKQK